MAFDTDEHIRVRAYHLWEADGRPPGRDHEYWERAQQSYVANAASPPAKKTARQTTKSCTTGAETQPAQRRVRRKA